MAPMRSTDFRAIVEPILTHEFDGIYDQRADEWKQCFRQVTGTPRAYHEEPVLFGFGAAPEMPDGTPVTYQSGGVLFIKRYVYRVYGLGFALTKVLVEDGDHIRLGAIYARHLAQSLIESKETLCVSRFNLAFSATMLGGDGVSLINPAHPIGPGAAAFSNQITTNAALSQTSLEQLLIQLRNAVDNTGKRIKLYPRKLVLPPALVFQGEVILKSVLRTGMSINDINPINSMGLLKEGQANFSRMTSTTNWFVQTDAPEGLKLLMRRGLEKTMEGDFETDSMRYKATERYDVGHTDPRCLYGAAGL